MNPPEKKIKREISAGIIVYRRTEDGLRFLILYHRGRYWNFPKGKIESEEKSLAAAIRETKEETGLGVHDLRLIRDFKAHERYYFRKENQPVYKIVIFYLAETRRADIKLSHEHNGYGWFLLNDARRILGGYRASQKILKQAHDLIRQKSTRGREPHSAR
ncbi:MAG: hypothetical protein UY96_C0002G0002 [Parcubacteria group bacterium GW2011_GWB1_56_8]|nr:MAG: hypothetical protein UY96_C0002G0002 [Parcubacteria group bacterium GW2011_GWB1_56_8]